MQSVEDTDVVQRTTTSFRSERHPRLHNGVYESEEELPLHPNEHSRNSSAAWRAGFPREVVVVPDRSPEWAQIETSDGTMGACI